MYYREFLPWRACYPLTSSYLRHNNNLQARRCFSTLPIDNQVCNHIAIPFIMLGVAIFYTPDLGYVMSEEHEVETRLAIFENDVRGKLEGIDRSIGENARRTNATLEKVTEAIDRLSEHMIRTEEREQRQQSFNTRIESEVSAFNQRLRLLEDAHNRDSDMMTQLRKHWVFIVIAAIGVATLLPQFFDRMGG